MQQFPRTAKVALVLNRSKLDALAESAGIHTDAELAGVLGTTTVTLWRIRNGHTYPSNEFMARCLHAFPYASLGSLFRMVEIGEAEEAV
jgi:hypothetical protein